MPPTKILKEAKPELVGWINPVQVAALTKLRYHKARDLMFTGAFGPTHYDEPHYLVEEKQVRAWIAKGRGKK
jgi:hypothetical protein